MRINFSKTASPISRQINIKCFIRSPHFILVMEKMTVWIIALHSVQAPKHFVVVRMIIVLKLPMALIAIKHINAPFFILFRLVGVNPILTVLQLVVLQMRFSTVIVPIMSIHAFVFIMFHVPWAPSCFVIENVEIGVFWLHNVK